MGPDSLTYRPPIDYAGADSFLVTVQDGRGGFASAPLAFTIVTDDGITGNPPPVLDKVGNQMRLRFSGTPGATYRFQRTTDFLRWDTLHTVTAGETGAIEYSDTAPPADQSFYRIVSP